ncbi:hypothetical protein ACTL6U_05665 [Rhodovibrionaceae bacterium A322]
MPQKKKRAAPKSTQKTETSDRSAKGPYLCIHVEKTAGTSFRSSVLDQFETVFDYGAISDSTSKRLAAFWQTNPKDLQYFRDRGIEAIYGHFPPEKYLALEPDLPVITWIRDPEERLVSDYNFRRRPNDIPDSPIDFDIQSGKLTFQDYLQRPNFQNVISRYLSKVPQKNFAFIGNTEDYADDLALFGKIFNCLPLSRRPKNQNNNEKYLPTAEERALLTELNNQDFGLYKKLRATAKQLKSKGSAPGKTTAQGKARKPKDHASSIWTDKPLTVEGEQIIVPDFLRNAWRLKGQHPSKFEEDQPKSLQDFQRWYLYHGINEFDPSDPVYETIVMRFTESLYPELSSCSYEWLGMMKQHPQVYLAYCLRSDLRKGFALGDEAGIDAFLRWWDSKALHSHGPQRQGLTLFPWFNWQFVPLIKGDDDVHLPRLLRDLWHKRPDLQKRFDPASPTFLGDFEKWFLLLGAKETETSAPAIPDLIERNYPSRNLRQKPMPEEDKQLVSTWFDRLKQVPRMCLVYLQRPDLRKDMSIGEEAGVINFLNWWANEGLKQFETPPRGKQLIYRFLWEPIHFDLLHKEIIFPRLWQNLWLARPDLQKAFPLERLDFPQKFQEWFLKNGVNEQPETALPVPPKWDLPA